MKRIFTFVLCIIICFAFLPFSISAEVEVDAEVSSAILIESKTGAVLYEKDADKCLAPASVTKIMTMLLIMEEIDSGNISYDTMITASANAASMGGSQVYLKEGEQFSVRDMLKSITMASANDCCVAMAEHISGSEENFVSKMNERAKELGMKNTFFENTNGLDDTTEKHLTTARDISIMSRELIVNHPDILQYTSVWMDSVRGGEFTLTNTNRLVRFYNGANGLKTGSTSKAGFCISASAERDGMTLIAVIMKATTRDSRNDNAKRLLDYGFSNYTCKTFDKQILQNQKVGGSCEDYTDFIIDSYSVCVPKGKADDIVREIKINDGITAPISAGDSVGTVSYTLGGTLLSEENVKATQDIKKITYFGLAKRLFKEYLGI